MKSKLITFVIFFLFLSHVELLADTPFCEDLTNIVADINVNDDTEITDLIIIKDNDWDIILDDCYKQKTKNKSGIIDYVIALIYFEKKNLEMYEKYLISSIKNNYDAYDELILLYMYGYETNEYLISIDPVKFLKFAEEGAKNNSPMALYRLGYAYKYGELVERDFELASNYFSRSADLGVINSKLELITLQSENYFETLSELELLMDSEKLIELRTTLSMEFILWHASQYAAAIHDYDKSIDYALQIIELLSKRKGDTFENLAYDYMILADAYNLSGKYKNALDAIDKALEIHSYSFAAVDSYLMQIFTRKALILENLKRKSDAFSLYETVDNYYSSDPLDYFLADHLIVQYKIAEHYLENNDLDKAKMYLEKTESNISESNSLIYDNYLPTITKILSAAEEFNKLDLFIETSLSDRKFSDTYSYAEALKVFSEHYYLHHNVSKCIELIEESLEIKEKKLNSNNINLIETKYILSKCYKKDRQNNKANQITREISNIYSENEKLNIFDLNDLFLTVFFDHLILLNQNPDPSSSEVFKLVKLIDSVNHHTSIQDLFIRDSIDDVEIKDALFKKESLKNQILGIENEIFKIRTSTLIDRELEKKYIEELGITKKNLEEINVNIDRNYPELNFLTNKINIDDKELLSLVPDGEKLLIYTSFENNLVIFLLGKNGYEIKIVRDRYDEIVANINKFRSLLQDPFSDIQSYKIAKIIYDDLIKPIQHMIEAKDKLVIINDEEISALPFASLIETNLMANEFSEEAWLLKKYSFNYLPSIDSYYLLKKIKDRNYKDQFFGIGNPNFNGYFEQLPNTEDEIYKISNYFNQDNSQILIGEMANEKIVKEREIDSEYLMFATHAVTAKEISEVNEPAIILSIVPNSLEDGYLTSTEILNKKFTSDLLILSACSTATPDLSGKYFSGLMRSFLYSGSRNLLSTLWSIETFSAEELTTNFFASNFSQYSESLRESQISLLKSDDYSHPFFWSPYIIVGVN